jgi:hypothetical protein
MFKLFYAEIIKDFGTRTYNDIDSKAPEIKAKKRFDFLTDDIKTYVDDITAEKVVLITETTKKEIKRIVAKAIEEGRSIPDTELMIDGLYLDNIIPNRSRTIARTEVVSASNYGSMAGAKQTSSKLNKIWIPTFDDSTRESHLVMANHPPIGLDQLFNVNGFWGEAPGDFNLPASEVINCRCAIGYDYAGLTQEQPRVEFPENPTPIIQNPLLPDEIAGVKRGQEMSFDEANHGKPNPNFSKDRAYRINCQSCVVTYEARLRGFEVKTLPFKKNSKAEKLSYDSTLAWLDQQTGLKPSLLFDKTANTPKKLLKFIDNIVQKNERYTLEFEWKGRIRSAHIISMYKNVRGELRLYDPQTGKSHEDVLGYFNQFRYTLTRSGFKIPTPPKILRIDDKMFNLNTVNDIMERELP